MQICMLRFVYLTGGTKTKVLYLLKAAGKNQQYLAGIRRVPEANMDPGPVDEPKLILIVEDEPDNREIMRTVVEDLLGQRALLAGDGETALALVRETNPSVVLMDLMMPILDGFEAIRRLKADPATAHIPVIAVTALGRSTDRQRALDIGADEYLSKPFDLDVLAKVLRRFLEDNQ